MCPSASQDTPTYAVPEPNLVPVSDYLAHTSPIPPSRMFLINKSLKVYNQKYPDRPVFDASQGDGGASLPGVSQELLERAARMQIDHGTAYDMPFWDRCISPLRGRTILEARPRLGIGPANVIGTAGGRDALVKAYQAMLSSAMAGKEMRLSYPAPWISYNWGPYGIGANVLYAPGRPEEGWATEEGLQACVDFAARSAAKSPGWWITSPGQSDRPDHLPERQVALAKAVSPGWRGVRAFDWMYHFVTDEQPMDRNSFLQLFESGERQRLMFRTASPKAWGIEHPQLPLDCV
jgi:hypothetical protein